MQADPAQATDRFWPQVRGFCALRQAARRAARGTRSGAARAFLCELEQEVLALQRSLDLGRWSPGRPRTFRIRDPKPRTISAAPFGDRVVHHALCRAIEPALEAGAAPNSYACRRGLGTSAALAAVRRHARRHAWFLKLDVRKYFETIDHAVLRRLLLDRLGPGPTLDLCLRIVGPAGRGLPIGALTSQHFANLGLSPVDAYILQRLRPSAYARYMDDLVVFADAPAPLDRVHSEIDRFVRQEMGLALRPEVTRLAPVRDGLPFLGFRIFPGAVRLDRARARRLGRKLRAVQRELAAGRLDEATAARQAESACAWAAQGDTLGLRRALVARIAATGGGP